MESITPENDLRLSRSGGASGSPRIVLNLGNGTLALLLLVAQGPLPLPRPRPRPGIAVARHATHLPAMLSALLSRLPPQEPKNQARSGPPKDLFLLRWQSSGLGCRRRTKFPVVRGGTGDSESSKSGSPEGFGSA